MKIFDARGIETAELGAPNPAGLAYSPQAKLFQILDDQAKGAANPTVVEMTPVEQQAGTPTIANAVSDPINAAFNGKTNSLYLLNLGANKLDQIPADASGRLPPSAAVSASFDSGPYGLQNAQGMTFNPTDGRLYLLDPAGKRMIRILPDANGGYDGTTAVQEGRIERIDLKHLGANQLKGIAFNPADGHVYVLGPADKKLFKITETGQLVDSWDISAFTLNDPQAMTFAPSGDLTDDPSNQTLYIADSGRAQGNSSLPGQILELAFAATPQAADFQIAAPQAVAAVLPTTLVRTIQTRGNNWSPPAPDPAGIDFRPNGRMLVSDSEVEEMTIYQGANVFEATSAGVLQATCTTHPAFSKEPTGVAVNLSNGHIFFSDDGKDRIFEVNLGNDGQYCTGDDVVTFISTAAFNSTDPEGVGFGTGKIFIADGLNREVYIVAPGPNGVFDGISPTGDDQVSHFDTSGVPPSGLGLNDPEGIDYNEARGTLFIISRADDTILVEATTSGALVNTFNLSNVNATSLGGLGTGPGSQNPGDTNIYLADRGVDNDSNPNENDGKIYEVSLEGPPPPTGQGLYFSLANSGSYTVGTVSGVRDEDVVFFDGTNFSMVFDGSDVGAGGVDLDAFHIINSNSFLMSFHAPVTLPGVGAVDEWDVVRFNATSTGSTTVGSYTMFFDGNGVELTTTAEDIDAVDVLPDGRLLISTTGNPTVTGVSDARDEDLLAFTPNAPGNYTSGTWAKYFDGSNFDLGVSSEDTDAAAVGTDGKIFLSVIGLFSVPVVSGEGGDVFVCTPNVTPGGPVTACNYSSTLYFDASAFGITGNNLDAFELP